MDRDDPKTNDEMVEPDAGVDDADFREAALLRAVLQALRGWMRDGHTVIITRDSETQEVRIETFDVDRDAAFEGDFFSTSGHEELDQRARPVTRRCPGPDPSITAARSRRQLRHRKR